MQSFATVKRISTLLRTVNPPVWNNLCQSVHSELANLKRVCMKSRWHSIETEDESSLFSLRGQRWLNVEQPRELPLPWPPSPSLTSADLSLHS